MSVRSGGPPRVLIVSASMGAGHDAVAAELARRLRHRGVDSSTVDWLALGGERSGDLLRAFYAGMLRRAPQAYELSMRGWARAPGFFEEVTRLGAGRAERRLLEVARAAGAALVVSTYNLAGQALGRLRESGRLDLPAVTVVTDAGAHPYWWHRGVDLHVIPVESARVEGAWRSTVADPLVAPEVVGVGGGGDRVVVTGGAWGSGSVEAVARDLADLQPLVLCGRDDALRLRLALVPGIEPLGWQPGVSAVLRRASCLVDSAAGTSTWEALAARVPVVAPPRVLPGHGRLNVDALAATGAIVHAGTVADLRAAAAAPAPSTWAPTGVDAADLVTSLL